MAVPANAAVRESRRRSTPLDVERVNVMKALTAAEHSRRQFILNFAASRDTQLLVPGQKSDAVKAAEEWTASWLNENGYRNVNNEFFKFTVDARLWTTHVGPDVDFPFAFMGEKFALSPKALQRHETGRKHLEDVVFLVGHDVDVRNGEMHPVTTSAALMEESSYEQSRTHQESPISFSAQTRSQRSIKQRPAAETFSDKKRSLSLNSLDDYKTSKISQDKFPLLSRLGRSWSRRLSSAS